MFGFCSQRITSSFWNDSFRTVTLSATSYNCEDQENAKLIINIILSIYIQ